MSQSFQSNNLTTMGKILDRTYRFPPGSLTEEEKERMRLELTVQPVSKMKQKPKPSLAFYAEDEKGTFTVPRFFGILQHGTPEEDRRTIGEPMDSGPFVGSLLSPTGKRLNPVVENPPQMEAAAACLKKLRGIGGALLSLPCAAGKCLGKDVPVIVTNGHSDTKMSQDIVPGDIVAGIHGDSLVTSTVRGVSFMYRIEPDDGGLSWTCNEEHILTLVYVDQIDTVDTDSFLFMDHLVDIELNQFLKLSAEEMSRSWRGVRFSDETFSMFQFVVIAEGLGNYFGFTLGQDENKSRFLLEDGTVTHNTVTSLWIAHTLGRKTAILLHKRFIELQWIEELKDFIPGAKVGSIRQDLVDVEGKDFVVCSIQTLMTRKIPQEIMNKFGTVVIDECHHLGARKFGLSLRQFGSRYMLGLSATPTRKDGLSNVVSWNLGPLAFQWKRSSEHAVADKVTYTLGKQKEKKMRNGNLNFMGMITDLSLDPIRNELILQEFKTLYDSGRHILLLSDRVIHLQLLRDGIQRMFPEETSIGWLKAGMKDLAVKAACKCRILLSTFSMASEALNVKRLDSMIISTPTLLNVEQIAGRILRPHSEKQMPLYIYISDPFSGFEGLGFRWFNYLRDLSVKFRSRTPVRIRGPLISDGPLWNWDLRTKKVKELDLPTAPAPVPKIPKLVGNEPWDISSGLPYKGTHMIFRSPSGSDTHAIVQNEDSVWILNSGAFKIHKVQDVILNGLWSVILKNQYNFVEEENVIKAVENYKPRSDQILKDEEILGQYILGTMKNVTQSKNQNLIHQFFLKKT